MTVLAPPDFGPTSGPAESAQIHRETAQTAVDSKELGGTSSYFAYFRYLHSGHLPRSISLSGNQRRTASSQKRDVQRRDVYGIGPGQRCDRHFFDPPSAAGVAAKSDAVRAATNPSSSHRRPQGRCLAAVHLRHCGTERSPVFLQLLWFGGKWGRGAVAGLLRSKREQSA